MSSVYVRDTCRIGDITGRLGVSENCSLYVEKVGKRFKLLVVQENGDGSGELKMWRFIPEVRQGDDE